MKRQGIWKNGKAKGLFKFFNSDGKIIKIEIWKNGKMVKKIFEINMENISFIINWFKNQGNKCFLDKKMTKVSIDILFNFFLY